MAPHHPHPHQRRISQTTNLGVWSWTTSPNPPLCNPQPPPRKREKEFKNVVSTPDELDLLVTAKNHDLKSIVAGQANADDWIFALITLQTMEGFSGAGNYGISRMNGGLGNRPALTLAPLNNTPGAHVERDILALQAYWPDIQERGDAPENGDFPSLDYALGRDPS